MSALPLDWRRVPRYLASDIPWIRERIRRGDIESALLAVRSMRGLLDIDIGYLAYQLGRAR